MGIDTGILHNRKPDYINENIEQDLMTCRFRLTSSGFQSRRWLCLKSALLTWEGVGVISGQRLHDVRALRSPRGSPPVRLDPVDELGAAVLQRKKVAVVLVQHLQHAHAVGIKLELGAGYHSHRIELHRWSSRTILSFRRHSVMSEQTRTVDRNMEKLWNLWRCRVANDEKH